MSTEEKVILLAMLKKEEGEGLRDILKMLENARVFTLKEGKKLTKKLRDEGFLQDGSLTIKGEMAAKEAEEEFKLT